ncbi:Hint domain-containing protein [Roseovarius sp. C7]|uniref:Hint domain-containing protein n=1 Tax=Roseovarius sp. C7 TaxID=3398643 RepID=UPI0039F669EB
MAFISEVLFRGSNPTSEWVEITLGPNDDPNDFVVSAYRDNGNLHGNAGIPGGEVRLSSLTPLPHTDNPDFTVYVIQLGLKNGGPSDNNEASGVALTNTTTAEVLDFYSASTEGSITARAGVASGNSSDPVLDHLQTPFGSSYQWDIYGNMSTGVATPLESVLCLTHDTPVRTPNGYRLCRDLRPGDLVWTLDRGHQPLRWIGQSDMSAELFAAEPAARPVHIPAHALAPGVPMRDLRLSRQHRVLIRSQVASRMCDSDEVLLPAIKLAKTGIAQVEENAPDLCYLHLLFDAHEIVDAGGALVESLLLGPYSTEALSLGRFRDAEGQRLPAHLKRCAPHPARPLLTGKRALTLLERLVENCHALQPARDDQPAAQLAMFY